MFSRSLGQRFCAFIKRAFFVCNGAKVWCVQCFSVCVMLQMLCVFNTFFVCNAVNICVRLVHKVLNEYLA